MNLYKIIFDNNQAVIANKLNVDPYENVDVEIKNGNRIINWLTLYANDESESISMANKLVQEYFQFLQLSTKSNRKN